MLEHVGIAAGVTEGFEVFADSGVNSFTVLGEVEEGQLEQVREQMEKYVKIYSWGLHKG